MRDVVLNKQEQAATERLASWRRRANRWHSGAEQLELDLTSGQKKKVDTLSRRIAEEQRLAESLAPTQQLVRPLLLIVPGKDH